MGHPHEGSSKMWSAGWATRQIRRAGRHSHTAVSALCDGSSGTLFTVMRYVTDVKRFPQLPKGRQLWATRRINRLE